MARLGDVFNLQMGKTPARANASYWTNGTNAWVSIADLSSYEKYVGDTKEQITDLAVQESGIKAVPADTIIMSFKLSLGKTAITKVPIYTNEAIMAFLPTEKYDVCPDYFFHLFSGRDWSEGTNRAVMGATLNKATLSNMEVVIPPLEEQRRIAAVLDKVSDLIAKRREQLDKLDELVKARFVEMFGDPVSNPKGWNIVELSHCLEGIDNGKSLMCDTRPRQGNWPAILKLSAATYGYYQPKENKAMLNENEFVNSAAVQTGDLLFTRKNTPELVGMCAYVYETPDKLMMPDLIFRLNTNETCNKIFLWKLINHELFRENIKAISSGSAKSMSNISKERLLELKIILPPIGLQRKFADFVRQTDKSKLTIQQSLDKLEVLKKALMQQYFR